MFSCSCQSLAILLVTESFFLMTGTMTSMSAADGLQAANRVMRRVTSEREYQPLASVDHHKLQALEADNRSAPPQPLVTPHP